MAAQKKDIDRRARLDNVWTEDLHTRSKSSAYQEFMQGSQKPEPPQDSQD